MLSQKTKFFELPDNTVVWRYMDFPKYVHLLKSKTLYFTRSDKFEDPYEGYINNKTKEDISISGGNRGAYAEYLNNPFSAYINCWHQNEYESAAMWDLYVKTGDGVAIQSTVGDIKNAIIAADKIRIEKVIYTDFESDSINMENLNLRFMYKRFSFQHENEIRAVYLPLTEINGGISYHDFVSKINSDTGKYFNILPDKLIRKVIVSPRSASWFYELVKDISKDFGIDSQIDQSKLYSIK